MRPDSASRYNTGIMFHRRFSLRPAAWLLTAAVLLPLSFAQTGKRPLNHNDYDGWRSISSQRRLSPRPPRKRGRQPKREP